MPTKQRPHALPVEPPVHYPPSGIGVHAAASGTITRRNASSFSPRGRFCNDDSLIERFWHDDSCVAHRCDRSDLHVCSPHRASDVPHQR